MSFVSKAPAKRVEQEFGQELEKPGGFIIFCSKSLYS